MTDPKAAKIRYPWPEPPASGEAVDVAPGILWARLPLPMALDHVNIYALDDGDGWTLIDTGFDTAKSRRLWQGLLDGPLGGRPINRVIVTHHHPDHIGLAGWFVAMGAELWTTRTAWLMARMLTLDEQARPFPETLAFWKSAGMDPEVLAQRQRERPFNFADVVHSLPLGFHRIVEDSVIKIGNRDWRVHFGQGHAPDHATFWSQSDTIVLGGDQLLPSISPNLSIYATEPEADPVADWMASCANLSEFATEDQLVLPGHKLPFTGLPLRLQQLLDNHHGALERLERHLEAPHTAAECFLPIFKRQITGGEYGLALGEAMAHCLHLWHAGRASRTRRDDGAWLWQRT